MKRNYLARELRLNAKSQIPGFRNSAFWNSSPPSAPLERMVTNEYFRVYGLAGKKGAAYVDCTLHFLLLPKIIVNKKIAKKLQRQPFSQPVFACLRLPAGRQGRQASTWKVRGNRIKQDEIASPGSSPGSQ